MSNRCKKIFVILLIFIIFKKIFIINIKSIGSFKRIMRKNINKLFIEGDFKWLRSI